MGRMGGVATENQTVTKKRVSGKDNYNSDREQREQKKEKRRQRNHEKEKNSKVSPTPPAGMVTNTIVFSENLFTLPRGQTNDPSSWRILVFFVPPSKSLDCVWTLEGLFYTGTVPFKSPLPRLVR